MLILKILFSPLSLVYYLGVSIRNVLYIKGFFKIHTFHIPLISVGNISMGGSGKTPHVEYLIRLLSTYNVVTLSRGYKRKSKGFILASDLNHVKAEIIGDEPFQYFKKFSPPIEVVVGEDRVKSLLEIQKKLSKTEVVLLDDAFQQRRLKISLNILLTTFDKPFYNDFIIPSGFLREARGGANRADMVIVTKCPLLISPEDKVFLKKNILIYTKVNTPVFFTSVKYADPTPVFKDTKFEVGKNIIMFSGVADVQPFRKYLKENFNLISTFEFSDHHHYQLKEINSIRKAFEKIQMTDKCIITTEKDMVKLLEEPFKSVLVELPVFYMPIEVFFLEREKEFSQLVMSSIKKYNN